MPDFGVQAHLDPVLLWRGFAGRAYPVGVWRQEQ